MEMIRFISADWFFLTIHFNDNNLRHDVIVRPRLLGKCIYALNVGYTLHSFIQRDAEVTLQNR